MITMRELNPKAYELTEEQKFNIQILHDRINLIRCQYPWPMIVTSGVRSIEDHRRIYTKKASSGPVRVPMGSNHLIGAACDILDKDGSLYQWLKMREPLLIDVGLWCEDGTDGWVHFQIFPPKSGKRWFLS